MFEREMQTRETMLAGYAPWMAAIVPADYEPDYDAHIAELESLEASMADVGTYDDWFPA